jgi:uncharacterized protein YcgI (DUF1989 family)
MTLVAGCCSAPSNRLLYDVEHSHGCRENVLAELVRHQLGRRDIVPNLKVFRGVTVREDNTLESADLRRRAQPARRT